MSHSATDTMKQKLLADFHAVMAEADELVKSVTDEGGGKVVALRANMENNLNTARERLLALEGAVLDKTKAGARAIDGYAHESPWQLVGVAAGVGAVIGAVLGLLLYRR